MFSQINLPYLTRILLGYNLSNYRDTLTGIETAHEQRETHYMYDVLNVDDESTRSILYLINVITNIMYSVLQVKCFQNVHTHLVI